MGYVQLAMPLNTGASGLVGLLRRSGYHASLDVTVGRGNALPRPATGSRCQSVGRRRWFRLPKKFSHRVQWVAGFHCYVATTASLPRFWRGHRIKVWASRSGKESQNSVQYTGC